MTGEVAEDPVVTPTGDVYSRRTIERHIATNGADPLTHDPLTVEQLVPVKLNNPQAVRPRAATATSVPALLGSLQTEWDALMQETFTLKQQLDTARTELSHALYQNDAACRVIARLIKERDSARADVEKLKAGGAFAMELDSSLPGLDNEAHTKLRLKTESLSKERRNRTTSPQLVSVDQLKKFGNLSHHPVHKTTAPGILSVCVHEDQNLVLTGGVDQTAVIFNRKSKKKVATLTGHKKQVNDAKFVPNSSAVVTASDDSLVKVWAPKSSRSQVHVVKSSLNIHSDTVSQLSVHPVNTFVASASLDKTWAFHDIETGKTLLQVREPEESPLTSVMIHPDGMIVATGTEGNIIRIWDLKSKKNVASFQGHKGSITDLCFSENGYYLATASRDKLLKLWDLRGPRNVTTLQVDSPVVSLAYDYSGSYLAAATGNDIRVFTGKSLDHVTTLHDHAAPVTDVEWGMDASFLASASMDRTLRFWG
eukprot:TRINITY_DN7049_c0_g1_i1.p1 TRINITY_DN7049_c0_g1~~TRINITY_DN7049_c0_g1_i1.p1  ORF type:complete len:504 (-),score=101.94 TRINITY_DN7049_c0_g1_i1:119-1561(-)